MKQCTNCLEFKSLGLFGNREKGKKKSHCRDCVNKANLNRYHTNSKTREAHRKASYKYQLKAYGISQDEYDEMYNEQQGCCFICQLKPEERLNIDHCHTTGKVRALLCRNCNTAIGHSKEDVEILKKIINYLEVWNERLGV